MRGRKKKARSCSPHVPCPSSEFTSRETGRGSTTDTSRSYLTGALRETDLRTWRGHARGIGERCIACETSSEGGTLEIRVMRMIYANTFEFPSGRIFKISPIRLDTVSIIPSLLKKYFTVTFRRETIFQMVQESDNLTIRPPSHLISLIRLSRSSILAPIIMELIKES